VRGEGTLEPSGEEGLADLLVLEAIARATKSGRVERVTPLGRARRPTPRQAIRRPPPRHARRGPRVVTRSVGLRRRSTPRRVGGAVRIHQRPQRRTVQHMSDRHGRRPAWPIPARSGHQPQRGEHTLIHGSPDRRAIEAAGNGPSDRRADPNRNEGEGDPRHRPEGGVVQGRHRPARSRQPRPAGRTQKAIRQLLRWRRPEPVRLSRCQHEQRHDPRREHSGERSSSGPIHASIGHDRQT